MKIEQLRIGDKGPAGGIIFINPATHGNTTGLWFEAGPCSNPDFVQIPWSSGYGDSGASGTKIGTGASNTKLITSMSGNTKENCAASYCASYSWNGFADWFLPSDDEMTRLWAHRDIVGGFDDGSAYWSSTQGAPGIDLLYESANVHIFGANSPDPYKVGKNKLYFVRPVRSFSNE